MRLDENPVFRKEIIPWYDSEITCFIIIAFMIFVFIFGAVGISVACDVVEYHKHLWLPSLLLILSLGVILSFIIRLTRRYSEKKNFIKK